MEVQNPVFYLQSVIYSTYIGVGIATGYGLDGPVQFPALQDFSLLHRFQTSSGVHRTFYPVGTGGFFPW
jgi:hypothetical protein